MNRLRTLFRALHSADLLIIGYGFLLSLLNLVFSSRIPNWWVMIVINFGVTVAICALAITRSRHDAKILEYVHDWYSAPLVFLTFKELYFIIAPMHGGRNYDDLLIEVDRWLFGVDPTRWLLQIANPVLTEVLQIAYTIFYILFLAAGYELYRRKNRAVFHFYMFTCIYGFYLSYLGYFTLPAVGPRFTLHDFGMLDHELPGLLLTPYLRWFVNYGESVPMGVSNAVAQAAAQRDVFPSGHTMMMLVLMTLSVRYRLRSRYFMLVNGTLLIVATVYQRYHYVVDLIGGLVFFLVCISTAPYLYRYTLRYFKTIDSRYDGIESIS
jgi:membrane-associated phospholipid phosphatase